MDYTDNDGYKLIIDQVVLWNRWAYNKLHAKYEICK
jgi:hypothetical protein